MLGSRFLAPLTLVALPAITLAQRPSASAERVASLPLSAPLPTDPAVIEGTLANGMRYIIRRNEKPEHRAELRLVVNAGSVLEDPDQRGLAHLVEHMAFNGTTHFKKNEIVSYLESVGMRFGADLNAYTAFDETVYMLQIPTDTARILQKGFQILDDWASGGITFDSADVEKERGVVMEEWRLGRGAGQRIQDKQFPVIFHGSRYAERLPIGDTATILHAGRDRLVRFYRDWYRPDLMTVVAVGDFDPRAIEQLVKQHFGDIPKRTTERPRTVYPVPNHDSTLISIATDKELTYSSVGVLYLHPVRDDRTLAGFRRQLVEQLYDQMLNARLDELTRVPDAPFTSASSEQGRFVRSKEAYGLFATVRNGGMVRGLEALLTEAARVERHGFTATELARAKDDLLRAYEEANAERDKTSSARFAQEYVQHALEGTPIPGAAAEYALAQRFLPTITLDEVNRLASEWITDTNRVILASAPDKPGVTVPTAAELRDVFHRVDQAQVAAYQDRTVDAPLVASAPAPGRAVAQRAIPDLGVTEWTLSNGVRVLLKPTDFKADEIVLRATSPGGTSLASDAQTLTASMAPSIVSQVTGVGAFDAVSLQKKLAGKDVNVAPRITTTDEGFVGSASPRDLDTMLQLVYLYFTAPRRDTTAFAAFVQNVSSMLANRSLSPQAAFGDTLSVTLANHNPRVRPITVAMLDSVKLDSALAFYRDRFADASDFTFVLVGNFTPDSIKPLVVEWLGALPSTHRRESWRDNGVRPPRGVVVREVHAGVDPRATTALVFTGSADTTRLTRYAMSALDEVLSIRLRDRLREALGGTYSVNVSGSVSTIPEPRYQLAISFGSAPGRVDQLTQAVFSVIDSLQATGPTAEEIAKVKELQTRSYETSRKQNGWWASQLAGHVEEGTSLQDILTYPSLVQSLTPKLVQDAARRFGDEKDYVRVTLVPAK